MNIDKAQRADAAMESYIECKEYGYGKTTDFSERLTDLLADLRHLCRA